MFIQLSLQLFNNDLDKHIQAKKANERKVLRFGDILAPLSRETELSVTLEIAYLILVSLDNGAKMSPKRRTFLSLVFACNLQLLQQLKSN